jgi:hypothetical protein
MGSRDKGSRENKKPKKDAKKAIIASLTTAPTPEVGVIRKKRKPTDEE